MKKVLVLVNVQESHFEHCQGSYAGLVDHAFEHVGYDEVIAVGESPDTILDFSYNTHILPKDCVSLRTQDCAYFVMGCIANEATIDVVNKLITTGHKVTCLVSDRCKVGCQVVLKNMVPAVDVESINDVESKDYD